MKKNRPVAIFISAFLLTLITTLLLKVHGDVPKGYKLSSLGEKKWAEITELNLPELDKKEIIYQSNALYAEQNPYEGGKGLSFSSNGKYKALVQLTEDEDFGIVNIFDSLGNKLLEEELPGSVLLSNNGDDFVTKGLTAEFFSFHKISKGKPTFHKSAPGGYTRYGFSGDAKYFIGAGGSILDLLTVEGDVLWRKNTNSPAPRELAFSYNADKIALALMPHLLGWQEPKLTDIKDTVLTGTPDRSLKNAFLFILNKNGEVLHSLKLEPSLVNLMAFTPDGEFLAVSSFNLLYVFNANTGKLVWKHDFNSECLKITSLAFAPKTELLAVAGVTCRTVENSDRVVYLFRPEGAIADSVRLVDNFPTSIAGPSISFTTNGKRLLLGTTNKLFVYTVSAD